MIQQVPRGSAPLQNQELCEEPFHNRILASCAFLLLPGNSNACMLAGRLDGLGLCMRMTSRPKCKKIAHRSTNPLLLSDMRQKDSAQRTAKKNHVCI
jgi:hypothetical protein